MLARTVLQKLLGQIDKSFASILIGPRQVGKTTILRQIEQRADVETHYFDMENPSDALVLKDGLKSLLSQLGPTQGSKRILMLDEFHRIPDALALFKQLKDHHPEIKVFASGSSSIEIHSHLKQSAVGRIRRTRIFPLSFPEWVAATVDASVLFQNIERPLPPRELAVLTEQVRTFMVWGGMPEAALTAEETERREILDEICSLYLEKDIRSLLKEEHVIRFNELLRYLCIRIGQVVNKSDIARDIHASTRHIDKQLLILRHTFVSHLISTDYSNPTKRLVKAPKLYWYDNGIRNALVRDFRTIDARPDGGAIVENHIYNEIEKATGVDVDVLYHRTRDGQEVDFVLERDRQKIAVEVKSKLGRKRIPRAVAEMVERDDCLAGVVLNEDLHEVLAHGGKPIYVLPWVLAHRIPGLFGERGGVSIAED